MGRLERQKAKLDLDDDDKTDDAQKPSSSVVILSSSDDEEANEDLSLKIVEKALLRGAAKLVAEDTVSDGTQGDNGGGRSSGVIALSSSSPFKEEVVEVPSGVSGSDGAVDSVTVDLGNRKDVTRGRRKKIKKTAIADKTVIVAKDEEKEEVVNASDLVELVEPNAVEITDNIVFRKLLRGPRYFDPPDSSWGTCFKCGEEGHSTANCTSVKRRRPCFVCGSLEHAARQCLKGRDCFICKNSGHRAKDCPEKHKRGSPSSKVCLKCGDSGHDMFSCRNDHSPDDLKGIQCYICKTFGHLCCVNSANTSSRIISCYRCGELGHTGLVCAKVRREASGVESPSSCFKCGEGGHFASECMSSAKVCAKVRGEASGVGLPGSCFKCGEGGHFARECMSSAKVCSKVHGETSGVELPGSCFKCGEGGHIARECMSSAKVCAKVRGEASGVGSTCSCFKCGEGGHIARDCMSSAKVCAKVPGEASGVGLPGSCFKCGEGGHFARECMSSAKVCAKVPGEASGVGSPGSCFKCGEGGHFARECMSNAKAYKRNVSDPHFRYSELKSIPFDLGKGRKRKKTRDEGKGVTTPQKSKCKGDWILEDPGDITTPQKSKRRGGWILEEPGDITTPKKSKRRGGWIAEDPGDYSNRKSKKSLRSPATPPTKGHKISSFPADGRASSSRSSNKSIKVHSGSTMSEGPSQGFFRPRFSASRFGNFGSDGLQRNHGW